LTGIRKEFQTYPVRELLGIATVSSDIEASIRRETELAGMRAVLKHEASRAETEEQSRKIRDVSERDVGYDVESFDRLIEVKSFKIKELVINLSDKLLHGRKQQFKVKPYILSVFDEAQEFIPDLSSSRGIDNECGRTVETLLRQGRKYGLGGCIATQRIAYLNTNALQQLHTYFVGTLPRPYDRNLVSNTFTIDQGILEKTLEFAPGEWLLSSYIATGIENVPIFIRADNAEKEIELSLSKVHD